MTPDYYPPGLPPVLFARVAEPGVAELQKDGSIQFLVTDRYANEARESGRAAAGKRVPASFETDLASLTEMIAFIAANPKPTPLPVTPPSGAIPLEKQPSPGQSQGTVPAPDRP